MSRSRGQSLPCVSPVAAVASLLLLTACGGALGERHLEPMQGEIALPEGVRTVRFEGATASFKVLSRDEKGQPVIDRKILYRGKLRLAADTGCLVFAFTVGGDDGSERGWLGVDIDSEALRSVVDFGA